MKLFTFSTENNEDDLTLAIYVKTHCYVKRVIVSEPLPYFMWHSKRSLKMGGNANTPQL